MSLDLKKPKGLFFDIYATLINWEAGIYPSLLRLAKSEDTPALKDKLLDAYHEYQAAIWAAHPTLPYPQILEQVYERIAQDLGVSFSREEQVAFGHSIGEWPAFPDTVEAMKVLSKYYKLFVLSNVDNASFERTRTGPLQSVHWDGIYTAERIGSYKPDPRNYEFVVTRAAEDFSIKKEELMMVAQSLNIDHLMSKKLGFPPGVWISRQGSAMGGKREEMEQQGLLEIGATYDTLGEFAEAVEKAFNA